MKKRISQVLSTFMILGILCPMALHAETRLFVPRFDYGPSIETQILVANTGDVDAVVDLWAFTGQGDLLGQFHLAVKAHGTRAMTLGEGLGKSSQSVSGWIGAVSAQDGIQLTYSRIGTTTESFEALEWTSKDVSLVVAAKGEVLHLSNPNAFASSVSVRSLDATGAFVATRQLSVGPFAQLEIPVASFASAAHLEIASNADVLASLDAATPQEKTAARFGQAGQQDQIALVLDSPEAVGAYQITLSFDPAAVQFSAKDFDGGGVEGFESKPLVVNVDNAAGVVILGSFQVGSQPAGRFPVARIRVTRRTGAPPRFGIQVDEVSDVKGGSLHPSAVSVGLVRVQ